MVMTKECLELSLDNLNLYCCCNENKLPLKQQFNQKNLMCGSALFSEEQLEDIKKSGFILDSTGDNISQHNKFFSELTGLYWIWKNTNHEYVGINHYRRFWNEEQIKNHGLRIDTMYVRKLIFDTSVRYQYIKSHGSFGLDLLRYAAETKQIPISVEFVDNLLRTNVFYANNFIIAHNSIFYKYCEFLFDCLIPIFNIFMEHIHELDEYQSRLVSFLSERIHTIFIMHKDYYCTGLKIFDVDVEEIL